MQKFSTYNTVNTSMCYGYITVKVLLYILYPRYIQADYKTSQYLVLT